MTSELLENFPGAKRVAYAQFHKEIKDIALATGLSEGEAEALADWQCWRAEQEITHAMKYGATLPSDSQEEPSPPCPR